MTTTSPLIEFGSNALSIRDDATFSLYAGALQSFSSLNDLKNDTVATKPYATFEPDYWLLDGNYKFAPATNAQAGLIGSALSDSPNGNFGTVIDVQIDFSVIHSTTGGLSFIFSQYTGDWLDSLTIKYYNNSYTLIREDTYTPSGVAFSTNQAVSNFRRIHITLNSTNKAYRFPRISRLDFDTITRFTGVEIKEARIVEQINPLSVELPSNTLAFTLHSDVAAFNIINPTGVYASLQYKQPLDVYEDINHSMVYMGRFYLDTWESLSKSEAQFKAFDAIGLLDTIPFDGMFGIHTIATSGGITGAIDDLFTFIDISYELDASFGGNIYTREWINKCSCREALQQIAIDIGAFVTCARSNKIKILPFELASGLIAYDHTLTNASKGMESPVTLRPLVTGVEITSHRYSANDETGYQSLFKGTLAAGNHRFYFGYDVPVWDTFVLSGATNTSSGEWRGTYIDINVAIAGTVEITGTKYKDFQKVYGVYNGSLPANTQSNIVQITNATLLTSFVQSGYLHASDAAQRIYNYYQQRYLQKTKLFASLIVPGDSVLIDSQGGRIGGIVEKMTTDLARGFVSDVEIVGVVVP